MNKTVMLCAVVFALVATTTCKSQVVIEDTPHFLDREIVKSSDAPEEDEEFLFDTINGWLTVGVADTVVLNKLGKPDSIVYEGFMEFSGYFYTEWIYDGIVLDMESDTAGAPSSVFRSWLLPVTDTKQAEALRWVIPKTGFMTVTRIS
jgi:hypothetical protein